MPPAHESSFQIVDTPSQGESAGGVWHAGVHPDGKHATHRQQKENPEDVPELLPIVAPVAEAEHHGQVLGWERLSHGVALEHGFKDQIALDDFIFQGAGSEPVRLRESSMPSRSAPDRHIAGAGRQVNELLPALEQLSVQMQSPGEAVGERVGIFEAYQRAVTDKMDFRRIRRGGHDLHVIHSRNADGLRYDWGSRRQAQGWAYPHFSGWPRTGPLPTVSSP